MKIKEKDNKDLVRLMVELQKYSKYAVTKLGIIDYFGDELGKPLDDLRESFFKIHSDITKITSIIGQVSGDDENDEDEGKIGHNSGNTYITINIQELSINKDLNKKGV